jgi:hypothetical protein
MASGESVSETGTIPKTTPLNEAAQDTSGWHDEVHQPYPPAPSRLEFTALNDKFESLTAFVRNLSLGAEELHRGAPRRQENRNSSARQHGVAFDTLRPRRHPRSSSEGSSSSEAVSHHSEHNAPFLPDSNLNAGSIPGNDGVRQLKRANTQLTNPGDNRLFRTLAANLDELKSEGKIKPRDVHEIRTLKAIAKEKTTEGVQQVVNERLAELYVASARSWAEAKNYQRRDLDELLGLPPPQAQLVVRAPSTSTKKAYKKKPTAGSKKK